MDTTINKFVIFLTVFMCFYRVLYCGRIYLGVDTFSAIEDIFSIVERKYTKYILLPITNYQYNHPKVFYVFYRHENMFLLMF